MTGQILPSVYELCLIMLGAMSLGAIVAKSMLLGKHQVRRADIVRIMPVAVGMLILEVDLLHEVDYLYNFSPTLLALHNPLLIISALAIVLGSIVIWVKLREGIPTQL